jgi:hypothetical protein
MSKFVGFLKFIGPMNTLTRGKMKFVKDSIYKVLDEEKFFELLGSGRFQQVRDPSKHPEVRKSNVRIHTKRPSEDDTDNEGAERGDLSQDDLRRGGDSAQRRPETVPPATTYVYKKEGSEEELQTTDMKEVLQPGNTLIRTEDARQNAEDIEAQEIKEERPPEADYPRLPSQQFTSKKEAAAWAVKNLGVQLDTSKSVVWLNKEIVRLHGEKYPQPEEGEAEEDDTRDENTTVEAIPVA